MELKIKYNFATNIPRKAAVLILDRSLVTDQSNR
jgi:hypothetical protein